jgi:hypothetical protein
MPVDLKYGRVTLERGTAGEDEPVVVFRAQDALLPTLLDLYVFLCRNAGSPERHVAGIHAAQQAVIEWQRDHFTQVPQSAGHEEA